jgi:hypothetical protein
MPQIGHRWLAEETLGLLNEQTIGAEQLKHALDLLYMFLPRRGIYEDVIEKYQDEPAKKRLEDVIHQGLKCCRCVRQSEGHDEELEVTMMRPEGRPRHVIRVHPHLMVAAAQIEFGEEAGSPEFIQQFINHWDRKFVLHRLVI